MLSIRSHLAAAIVLAAAFAAGPAFAQASNCQDAQKFLSERQSLIQQINKLGGEGKNKQIDPRAACGVFTKLVNNGSTGVKWLESNKAWCQVPDQFAKSFEEDHKRAVDMKSKACNAAAKVAEMERQAKKAQQQGNGLLGGGGLTGSYTMPKGAL